MLVFHPALAPYRIDQFNTLNEKFDLHVIFLNENLLTFKYDQNFLLSQCSFKLSFLLKGPQYKDRLFRFGMLMKIRSIKPDIVLGYEYSFTTQYLILLKRLGIINIKIGSMVDDSLNMCFNIQSRIRFQARKYSIKYLDFLVLLSQEVSLYYQNQLKLSNENIIVSPIIQSEKRLRENSATIEIFSHKYANRYNLIHKKVLLFVGRLIAEKGLSQFLNNIYSALQKDEDLVFVIIGEGNDKELLQLIINQKGLQEKVYLAGRYEKEELYAWYLCASGFVLPSVFEPFGAVVNEALIFGLPVLCSKYAGASSLITPENGIKFDPLDQENTLESLKLFLVIINPLSSIDLNLKPSLMREDVLNFNEEWGKLIN